MRSNDPHDNGVEPVRDELYPRCAGCGYRLEGLPEPRCPECGRGLDFRDPSSYEFAPPMRFWAYWTPGLLLAGGTFALVSAVSILIRAWPSSLLLSLPVAVGVLLGYGTRLNLGCGFLIAMLGLGAVVGLLISGRLEGLVGGAFFGMLLTYPCALGMSFGIGLRGRMKRSTFGQRWHLP